MRLMQNKPHGRSRKTVVAAAVAVGLGLASASSAAAAPTGVYADFKYCPVNAPNVVSCLYSETTSGEFKFGNAVVPINKKIVLQGGVAQDPTTFETTFVNAAGAPTLSPTPLTVPGGLSGLFDPQPGWNGILTELVEAAINAVNGVTATAELVGPVKYNLLNFIAGTAPTIELPVRVKLDNPFLGDSCYIGSASSPVSLKLRTGTTAPPPPNTPITGSTGTVAFPNPDLITATGYRLVDNAFSVPSASGCGPLLFRPLINAAVNLKEGLPSAAGRNRAILQGSLKQGSRSAVVASGS